jgi:hypothetical protein
MVGSSHNTTVGYAEEEAEEIVSNSIERNSTETVCAEVVTPNVTGPEKMYQKGE